MKLELFEGIPLIDRTDPAPEVREKHGDLYLSYRCAREPHAFAVVCFRNCKAHFIGWPPAAEISNHPLFIEGLQPFQVHVFRHGENPWRWIVTMSQCTLDLEAVAVDILAEEISADSSIQALDFEIEKRYNN